MRNLSVTNKALFLMALSYAISLGTLFFCDYIDNYRIELYLISMMLIIDFFFALFSLVIIWSNFNK